MKPKVYITRRIPESAYKRIADSCDVEMWKEENIPVPRSVLEQKIRDIDGLLSLLTDPIDRELIGLSQRLEVISNMAVGFNNIDITEASRRGILVTNTPRVLTETTADLTFALLLAAARRIVEASHYLRAGKWKTWSPMLLTGQDVYGSTIGIIGMGRIGEALARRAKGFDMRILYYNRSRKEEAEQRYDMEYSAMDRLLAESDYVCVMVPYSKETHHLIGSCELAQMKHTAVLINTARGGIVDEDALYDALLSGTIWAAGLDVFEEEPVEMDNRLLTLSNVVTLPHIGSASVKTRTLMAELAASNLLQALSGETPSYTVNKV